MSGFRGTDEQVDREIALLERTVQLRVRRAARDLHELERDLRELRKERARRRASSAVPNLVPEPTAESRAES
jgi:hypothetical protein